MRNRILGLTAALLLIASLAACGSGGGKGSIPPSMASGGAPVGEQSSRPAPEEAPSGEPPSQAEPQAPAREPAGSPAVIDYPELAPQELAESPLYREALERPSVIIWDGEPLTNAQPVKDFLAAVEQKKDGDLYIYSFSWDYFDRPSLYYQHFFCDAGDVAYRYGAGEGWNSLNEDDQSYPVYSCTLNEYGYLILKDDFTEPNNPRVVNDRALYSDAEERQRLYHTYILPIAYTAMGNSAWSSAKEAGNLVWLFEEIYGYENDDTPWDRFGGSDWPVDEMVETLSRYFDGVSASDFISSRGIDYNAQTGTIHYEGGRGGGPKCLRVVGHAQEGDRLSIDYVNYNYATGVPEGDTYRLTVRLLEDGSFRYLTNEVVK